MGSIQYKAALTIRCSSREKLYHKLDLNPYNNIDSIGHFTTFSKNQSPKYLFHNIPVIKSTYRTRYIDNNPHFNVRHTFFRNSYFPSAVTEWNNLDKNVNSESF